MVAASEIRAPLLNNKLIFPVSDFPDHKYAFVSFGDGRQRRREASPDRTHPSSSAVGSALGKLFISHVLRNARLNRFVRARCRRSPRTEKPFAYYKQQQTFGWLITRRSRSSVDAPHRSSLSSAPCASSLPISLLQPTKMLS